MGDSVGTAWNPETIRLGIARDLRAIERMFADLRGEAVNRAGDPLMPGGAAMVLLGPGADVEAFGYAQLSAIMGRTDADSIETDDLEPPLSFLASWEDIVREERDQPVFLRATIARSAKYLRESVDWMLSLDEYGDARFIQVDDFAEQLGNVRRAMENVLRDGSRADRIRAECKSCDDAPRLCLRRGKAADGSQDHWYCPNTACGHGYDERGVAACWRQMFVRAGKPPVWIRLRQAATAINRPVSTVRTWTLPPLDGLGNRKLDRKGEPKPARVESERRDDGQTWVRWEDLRAVDDTTRRRGRNRLVA